MRRIAFALIALHLAACGPDAALWVRIEAPLVVPEECDSLALEIRREGADGELAFSRTFDLTNGPNFPLTATFTSDDGDLRGPLFLTTEALLDGSLAKPWARATAGAELESGALNEVLLELCDCAAD